MREPIHQSETSMGVENGRQFTMGNDFNKHFNWLFTIFPTSISDFKASALNWRHVFHCMENEWKVVYATGRIKRFNKHQRPVFCVMFLKQPMRTIAPLPLKRAVHLGARNSCIKFYTCLCYLFIIMRNTFKKWKSTEADFSKEKTKIEK